MDERKRTMDVGVPRRAALEEVGGRATYTLTTEAGRGERLHESVRAHVIPLPRLEALFVPAPALTHTVLLRLHVGTPDARVSAPSFALAPPEVRLDAPDIRLGAPSLRVPLSLNLAAPFAQGPLTATPASPSRLRRSAGAGTARIDPLRPFAEVFEYLRGRLRSELTSRFGGMP